MLKYICFSPISFLDFLKLTIAKAKKMLKRTTALGVSRLLGASLGASTWPHFLPPTSSTTVAFRKVVGVIKTTSGIMAPFYQNRSWKDQIFAKECFFTLVKKGLALGSSGCLLVTLPRMVQYTGKWLLLSPYWSHPRPHKMGKRDE